MANTRVYKAFNEFLRDKNLSLRAKGFLTMILTDNLENGLEALNYCTDSIKDIQDTLLELRINHYIKYNAELNILEADAITYDKRNELER